MIPCTWENVTNSAGKPHAVGITYNNLVDHGRAVPCEPFLLPWQAGFRYDLAFMDAFADSVCSGLTYAGIIYDGPVLEYTRDVPQGGVDVIDTKVYWLFPSGVLRCLTMRELRLLSATEFTEEETVDAYHAVAEALGYRYLGGRCDMTGLRFFLYL